MALVEPVQTPALWESYDAFLFEENRGLSCEDAAKNLEDVGYTDVIHRGNQQVAIFSYKELKRYRLEELESRFVAQDPLLDPYIRHLDRYYEGSIGEQEAFVVYAKRGDFSFETVLQLRNRLDRLEAKWARAGTDPFAHAILLGAATIVLVAIAWGIARRYAPAVLLAAMFTAAGVLTPEYHYVISALLLSIGTALGLRLGIPTLRIYLNRPEDVRRRTLLMPPCAYGLFAAAGAVYPFLGSASAVIGWHILLAALMQITLVGIVLLLEFRRYVDQQHRLFYPLSLGQKRSKLLLPLRTWAPAMGVLLFLPFLLDVSGGAMEGVRLPVPASGTGHGDEQAEISYRELYRTYQEHWNGQDYETVELPNLVDYLAHRAYQEGYFYGRSYGFPAPGERITLTTYSNAGQRVETKEKTVKLFTDDWYEDIIAEARENGIERLLYAQGVPVEARIAAIDSLRITVKNQWGHAAIVAVLSLFLFTVMRVNRHPMHVYRRKQGAKERRKVA